MGGTNAETGSAVQAAVLDIAKAERLVDLSLKPEFVDKFKDQASISEKSKKVVLKLPYFFFLSSY